MLLILHYITFFLLDVSSTYLRPVFVSSHVFFIGTCCPPGDAALRSVLLRSDIHWASTGREIVLSRLFAVEAKLYANIYLVSQWQSSQTMHGKMFPVGMMHADGVLRNHTSSQGIETCQTCPIRHRTASSCYSSWCLSCAASP